MKQFISFPYVANAADAGNEGTPEPSPASFDLESFWRALRRNAVRLLCWLCFCWAVAGAIIAMAIPEYVASTQIILLAQQRQTATAGSEGAQITLDSAQADSRIQVIKSERLLRFVFETLGLGEPQDQSAPRFSLKQWLASLAGIHPEPNPEGSKTAALLEFMNRVNVHRIGLSYVIEISVRAGTPKQAARLANAVTDAYLRDLVVSDRSEGEVLQQRIADASVQANLLLDNMKAGTIPSVAISDADARIIGAAIEPLAKSSPQVSLIMALATVAALVTGLGAVSYVSFTDRTVRSRWEAWQKLGLVCLAVVPKIPSMVWMNQNGVLDLRRCLNADHGNALRGALNTMLSTRQARDHRAIGLLSWKKGEGTSATALGLSLIVSESQQHVSLIDANVKDPFLTRLLAPADSNGLIDALVHDDPQPALWQYAVSDNLGFVPLGSCGNSQNGIYFGSLKMQIVVRKLKEMGPVILDLPPISATSDSQHLGALLDGVIVVVEAGVTSTREVNEALMMLRANGVQVLGMILNKADAPPSRKNNGLRAA